MDPAARSEYFREIAARLLPGGILFNADLMADSESPDYPAILNLWMSVLHQTSMDAAKKQEIRETYERDVAILPAHKVVSVIEAGGFNKALACYQAGMITAHTAFKS